MAYRDSTVDGNHLVVVGSRSSLRGSTSVGYGNLIDANGERNVAVGYNVKVRRGYSTAIGGDAYSDGVGTVALGHSARAYSENSIAIGSGSSTVDSSAGDSRIAIGGNAYAGTAGYTGAIALGGESRAEYDAIAVGKSSQAKASGALAAGRSAHATGAGSLALGMDSRSTGKQAIALGQGANASAYSAFAIGAGAKAVAEGAVAFGYGAQVNSSSARFAVALGEKSSASHLDSVALGARSTTSATNQVSVGNSSMKRKIVNVADGALGTSSSDAVTGKQLHATNQNVTAATSTANTARTTANSAKTAADSALSKANVLGGLLGQTGSTGTVRLGEANGGSVLDIRNSASGNRRLSGVADGTISTTSSDAISGRQLHATNQTLAATTSTANAAKSSADSALSKANTLAGLLSQTSSSGSVRLGAANSGGVLDVRNSGNSSRRITGVADGALTATSIEAVNGRQLHATNEAVNVQDGRLDGQDGLIADNRDGLERLREAFEDFDPDLDGVVMFSADRSRVDMDGALVTGVGAGDIDSATSTDAVNGGQLHATNQRIGRVESVGRLMAFGDEAGSVDATAGIYGVAIGNGASASPDSEGGTAVGTYASALALNSVALGRAAYVSRNSVSGFALGAGSNVDAHEAVAMGVNSKVLEGAHQSIALGADSVAVEENTLSIGGIGLERRIANVARGTTGHNAVTVIQLDEAIQILGGGAAVDAEGFVVAPSYRVQGGVQHTVGDALNVLDGAVVAQAEKTGRVEQQLDDMFQAGAAMRADGIGQLNLAGAQGMVLSNLADGRIAAGSRDAVTGSQLFEAKADIARNRDEIDRLQDKREGRVAQNAAASVAAGNPIDFGGATLTGVSDGRIAADSSDVVTGGQLHATHQRIGQIESVGRLMAFGDEAGSVGAGAGIYGVALGNGASASPDSEGGTAVGAYSFALGMNSVALGRGSYVSEASTDGIAIGLGARVNAVGGLAIGKYSLIENGADNAVALGRYSIADESNTVSIGHASLKRRLTNLARGTASHNAVTVGQLSDSLAVLGGGAGLDANGNVIRPTYTLQGRLQNSLGEALSALDGAVIEQAGRTERVEQQLNSVFQDGTTVRADGLGQLNLAGANGMVLGNVANGLVAAGSRDAVNGGQLHAMQQQLNTRIDGVEQRIDGRPEVSPRTASTLADTPQDATGGDRGVIAAAPPKAEAPAPEAPTPQVDTAELEKMLARANEYSDGISRQVDARLDKMDKRFNRMAAMSSAQSAMAMNTAGLNTYNRLGAGVGYSDGESAMAVGYQRVLNEKGSATFSLNGAFTNSGERTMGVGLGIGW
ncbi:hypothetical protein C1932_15705 [Stenotrophomonas sp. YAU14D1_LEIMI4_1]|nr:hypothetical protein C1932_15705 [Stenotrophomonas sp. YAU14D1_LEIMI4_1]